MLEDLKFIPNLFNKELGNKIKSGKCSKKIIVVLNKIYLITIIDCQKNLSGWFPGVLFKSNNKSQIIIYFNQIYLIKI